MKFAYLIMSHNNWRQLLVLLKLLDYPDNDIYLHIDKKSEGVDIEEIYSTVHQAVLHVYCQYKVCWGKFSQTKCQVFLLAEAIKTPHDYYHLISGADLPIKKNSEIQKFFKDNEGREFVHFESDNICPKENCRYYHLGDNIFAKVCVSIQKRMNIYRKFYCGANWYSITHNLAKDFCSHKNQMLDRIKWTKNSDEYILQTFIKMVSDKEYEFYKHTNNPNDYSGTARLIDWHRGQPYVWRKVDFEELVNSDRMFARKFDEKVDYEIIEMVEKYVHE